MDTPMLMSYDVFSHTRPSMNKIKRYEAIWRSHSELITEDLWWLPVPVVVTCCSGIFLELLPARCMHAPITPQE